MLCNYNKGELISARVVFNDELKENLNELNEVESVTVISSYYEDNPYLNKTFYRTDIESARTIYKKETLKYYKDKFIELLEV